MKKVKDEKITGDQRHFCENGRVRNPAFIANIFMAIEKNWLLMVGKLALAYGAFIKTTLSTLYKALTEQRNLKDGLFNFWAKI